MRPTYLLMLLLACSPDCQRRAACPNVVFTAAGPGVLAPSASSSPVSGASSTALDPTITTASTTTPDPPVPTEVFDSKAARVEEVPVPGDLPVFVVRGKKWGERMVFIHGVCGAPAWYASTMQQTAARLGTLIAIQGNVPCGQGYRDWSSTPKQLNARIEAAFRSIGDMSELHDMILIGYSSGGTYSEGLIKQYPSRYTRAILIAEPQRPQVSRLKTVRGVVAMAGSRDRQDLMKNGVQDLTAAHIPSRYMILPEATHGQMGSDPERVMSEALDWLLANQLPASDAGVGAGAN